MTAAESMPGADWDSEEERSSSPSPRPRLRTRQLVLAVLGIITLSGLVIWWGLTSTSGLSWVDTGHHVASERQVEVRFDLRRDPDRAVTCQLEAQDIRHAVVGRTEVTVEPTQSSPSRHTASVQTASPAVTGYVASCRYAD